MSAPTARPYPRSIPPVRSASGGVSTRLPWWAVALPAVAFVALLLLIAGPADAQAASESGVLSHVVGMVRDVVPHQ
ncbi:hypothetical protein LRS74_26660 [Streptomyces sp. LX-29]|uniref:hypothetical protein n=1 Tax=unclassified Streptomyces TaxID=2593676 RepID=UPI001184C741|nr:MULTISPECIES: hypothetical protein [unclassified Streptomyces]TVL90705.1 hypothetical protein CD790_19085 [Streptomyces sp. SAJ15]WFB10229.1 hypothetical protein LRS74_26660 [Streptomyces sp. LX-29]